MVQCLYTHSEWFEQLYDETHNRTSAALLIALAGVQSSNDWSFMHSYRIIYNTRFFEQQVQTDARNMYIARLNALTSRNGNYKSCEFRTSTISYAIIFATVYYIVTIISNFVGRFFLCANCQRDLM